MNEEETKAVTERWFEALHSGNREAALACLADNVQWVNNPGEAGKPGGIPGLSAIVPWLGEFSSRAEVAHSFDVWGGLSEVLVHEPLEIIIQGDQTLAIVHEAARIKTTGLVYEIEFVQRLRIANNSIVMLKAYWDTCRAVVAFRGDMAARLLGAAASGDTTEAQRILPYGANPDQPDPASAESALMIAAKNGHTEMVKLLLSYGAEPNLISRKTGLAAIHRACQAGQAESVRALVEAGAFVDIQCPTTGQTPLHDALAHGSLECAEVLLDAGANKRIAARDGKSPADIAVDCPGANARLLARLT